MRSAIETAPDIAVGSSPMNQESTRSTGSTHDELSRAASEASRAALEAKRRLEEAKQKLLAARQRMNAGTRRTNAGGDATSDKSYLSPRLKPHVSPATTPMGVQDPNVPKVSVRESPKVGDKENDENNIHPNINVGVSPKENQNSSTSMNSKSRFFSEESRPSSTKNSHLTTKGNGEDSEMVASPEKPVTVSRPHISFKNSASTPENKVSELTVDVNNDPVSDEAKDALETISQFINSPTAGGPDALAAFKASMRSPESVHEERFEEAEDSQDTQEGRLTGEENIESEGVAQLNSIENHACYELPSESDDAARTPDQVDLKKILLERKHVDTKELEQFNESTESGTKIYEEVKPDASSENMEDINSALMILNRFIHGKEDDEPATKALTKESEHVKAVDTEKNIKSEVRKAISFSANKARSPVSSQPPESREINEEVASAHERETPRQVAECTVDEEETEALLRESALKPVGQELPTVRECDSAAEREAFEKRVASLREATTKAISDAGTRSTVELPQVTGEEETDHSVALEDEMPNDVMCDESHKKKSAESAKPSDVVEGSLGDFTVEEDKTVQGSTDSQPEILKMAVVSPAADQKADQVEAKIVTAETPDKIEVEKEEEPKTTETPEDLPTSPENTPFEMDILEPSMAQPVSEGSGRPQETAPSGTESGAKEGSKEVEEGQGPEKAPVEGVDQESCKARALEGLKDIIPPSDGAPATESAVDVTSPKGTPKSQDFDPASVETTAMDQAACGCIIS